MHRRAVKFIQVVQRPLVHSVGHQQHLDAFFLEDFELRAVLGGGEGVGSDVVNGFLALLHARLVVGQAHTHRVAGAAGKAQQLGQPVLVAKVFAQACFESGTKFVVELGVLASVGFRRRLVLGAQHIGHFAISGFWQAVVAGQVFEHAQHALGAAFADGLDVAAFLQQLAADIERQVGRIDHAFDKAQVGGHQRLGVVHDEDALDVELDAG